MSEHECANCTSPMDASNYDRRICRECENTYAFDEWEVQR